MSDEAALRDSWDANAGPWTAAVRENRIASRNAGTDRAIVEAVRRSRPRRVLDVGCGEGWLVRRLARDPSCEAVGIDGSAALIAEARAAHPDGAYIEATYAALVARPNVLPGRFDAIVCNFALLGEEVAPVLGALRGVLAPGGRLLIQTLHPWTGLGASQGTGPGEGYADGWREETFAAFDGGDWRPMPWYFRTLGGWLNELAAAGLCLIACEEPRHPATGAPLSLLMDCGVLERGREIRRTA